MWRKRQIDPTGELGRVLALPVTHLDALYYDEHWKPLTQEEFGALQKKLVACERWVVDGNCASTMPIRLGAADTVIFLDLPAVTCLLGIVERRHRYRGGQHVDRGVYGRITWGFVRYVIGFRRRMRPWVLQMLAEHARYAEIVVLRSRRRANRYVAATAREHLRP